MSRAREIISLCELLNKNSAGDSVDESMLTHHNLKEMERITPDNFFLLEPRDILSIKSEGPTKDHIVLLWKQEDQWTYVKRESFTGTMSDYLQSPTKRRWTLKQESIPDLDAVYQGKV